MSKQDEFHLTVDLLLSGSVPLVNPSDVEKLPDNTLIIDARSEEEYGISHIQGAQLVEYDDFEGANWKPDSVYRPVLVYCTVGYRSEKIGEKFKAMGYDEVYNLYGGLLEWKNKGNEVVNSDGLKTDSIHGYSPAWGRWLSNGIAVYDQ